MTTKQRILNAALSLFSEKGYSAVYVGEIAEAVGIRAPSLYKHYKSKQEIFDSCVQVFSERTQELRNRLQLPGTPEAAVSYQTASPDTITQIALRLFEFYLSDEVAAAFRKMLMIERYRSPELNRLFEDLFIDGAVRHEERIFSELIEAGVLRAESPHILALRFYTPIFYLLQKYDVYPDRLEEAKAELKSVVQEFCRLYRAEGDLR